MNFDRCKISKIVIVGAGPAGSSLAIRLANAGFEVVLIEKAKFPRQKLCGEFISPECLDYFHKLDVLDDLLAAGGDRISQTIFYGPSGKRVAVQSKWFGGQFASALSISRAEMDFRLLEKARICGATILEDSIATGLIAENGINIGVKARTQSGETVEIFGDLIVDATGRAAVLTKLIQRQTENTRLKIKSKKPKTKYVGFKTHLKNVEMQNGACEIYFFRGGYGGLSFVERGFANHCFLIKAEVVKEFNGDADRIVENVVLANNRAAVTLKNAEVVRDWLAVSIDEFGRKNLCPAPGVISIGDASAFIDPFTGSGMLMALESAEILGNLLIEKYLCFEDLFQIYQIQHQKKFLSRLRVCAILRHAAFRPLLANLAIFTLNLSKSAQEFLSRATRSTKSVGRN